MNYLRFSFVDLSDKINFSNHLLLPSLITHQLMSQSPRRIARFMNWSEMEIAHLYLQLKKTIALQRV